MKPKNATWFNNRPGASESFAHPIKCKTIATSAKSSARKKQSYLQLHEPEYAHKLEQLANEEVMTKQLIFEITEAEEAGDIALTKLGQAAASLHSASGFSTWDTFLEVALLPRI